MYFFYNKELTMSVQDGMDFIIEQFNNLPPHIKNNPMAHIHEYYIPFDSQVTLKLPGRKTDISRNVIDYRFEFNCKPFSHEDICRLIYYSILHNKLTYDECLATLEETYSDGLYYYPNDNDGKNNLRKILFWASLQEEINYPLTYNLDGSIKRYGRLLAFCRYAEALASTNSQNRIHSIESVCNRANNHGKQAPVLWNINNIPQYYADAFSRQSNK